MPTWLNEWTLLYVLVLTIGYIVIFTFLGRHNRRKKDDRGVDSREQQQ